MFEINNVFTYVWTTSLLKYSVLLHTYTDYPQLNTMKIKLTIQECSHAITPWPKLLGSTAAVDINTRNIIIMEIQLEKLNEQ